MKKIALHWQILIALFIAVGIGLILKTNYKIDENTYETIKEKGVPENVAIQIKDIEGKTYKSKNELKKIIITTIGEEKAKEYSNAIIKATYNNPRIEYVRWMGVIFMRALKMLIIPLIISSIISGIANIGSADNLGRLGLKTISYYILTSTLAIITGLLIVNIIQPGVGADIGFVEKPEGITEANNSVFSDMLIKIIPENIFQTFSTNGSMLSVIFFSVLFGFFITKTSGKSKEFLMNFFNSVFEVMMKLTMFVIKFTPIGIIGIVAVVVADQSDFLNLVQRLGLYMLSVMIALLIHAFITLPLITYFIGKSNPWKHLNAVKTPLLTAFSTSSSSATLPLTISAVENKSGVSNKITSFTLPLGATINMDGTALYECVAVMFIAQAYGQDMGVVKQVIVVVTALLASIGAAGIPMAGLVMMSVVLTAVGLPLEGVGLIIAVDRILDMFRTATNVWSDSCGAVIIAKSEGEVLKV